MDTLSKVDGRSHGRSVAPPISKPSFSRDERIGNLPGPLDFVAVQIDRRGIHGCMAQVVAHRGEFRAATQRMRGVRVAHPVRTRAAQLFCKRSMIGLDGVGGQQEEASKHAPQTHAADRGVAVGLETADDRRFRAQCNCVTGSPRSAR